MTITEPLAVIIGLLLLVKVVMDNRQIRKMNREIKQLNGMIFRKDTGILDILETLKKTNKPGTESQG